MLFFFGLFLGICAASEYEDGTGEVMEMTDELFKALGGPKSIEDLPKFYADNATITCGGDLPLSGTYTKATLPLMLKRWDLTWEGDEDTDFTIIATDEAKGTAMVSTEQTGTFLRTGQSATMSCFHVLEWDQVDKKVLKHLMIDNDMKSTTDAYRTLAEKKLWAMLWAFYGASFESIVDLSAKSWQMVAEDMTARNNMFPQLLSSNEWKGKQELAKGFEEWFGMLSEAKGPMTNKELMSKVMMKMKTRFTVLFASDTEVFASFYDGAIISHYTFEEGTSGLLIAQECLFSKGIQPWDIYPFPVPMKKDDEQDDRD